MTKLRVYAMRVFSNRITEEQVAEAIRKFEEIDNDDIIAIRIDQAGLPIGHVFPRSREWEDGYPTDEILDGTSCLKPNMLYNSAGYPGDQIYAVSGQSLYEGNDPGEIIIKDATVVAPLLDRTIV